MLKKTVLDVGYEYKITDDFSIKISVNISQGWEIEIISKNKHVYLDLESTQKAIRIMKFYNARCAKQ